MRGTGKFRKLVLRTENRTYADALYGAESGAIDFVGQTSTQAPQRVQRF
jgi:hypothetical protein